MFSYHEMPQELRRGLMVSALFHLGLAALFLLATVGVDSTPLRFAEVAFISGSPGGQITSASTAGRQSAPAAEQAVSFPARPAAKQQESARPRPAVAAAEVRPKLPARTEPVASSPVMPPKRRMLENEEPAINRQEQGKITPGRTAETPSGTPASGAASGERGGAALSAQPAASDGRSGGSTAGGTGQTSGANRSTSSSQGSGANQGGGSGQPFTIEGDAAQRLIVKQVIPKYPDELQQEAVLQFRFTVQPDGRLTGLIPMRKGDPTLEKITLAALRQWLFNPLPSHVEQKSVQGVITFRYQLE